jgi:hypothetical protein
MIHSQMAQIITADEFLKLKALVPGLALLCINTSTTLSQEATPQPDRRTQFRKCLSNCDYKRNETLDLCERAVLKDLPGGYKLCVGGIVGGAEECMYNCLIEFQGQIGTK